MGISKMDLDKTYNIVIDDNGNEIELSCRILSNAVIMIPHYGESYNTNIVHLASVLKSVKGIVTT